MGSCTSRIEARILILGLDQSGKTTLLYKARLGELLTTIPTIGFNVESLNMKNVDMTAWDVGGQAKIRPLWRHYYNGAQGLIYMVDSSDRARVQDSFSELKKVLESPEMANVPLLLFANKQDVEDAMDVSEISEVFEWDKVMKTRNCKLLCGSVTNNQGVYEALDWLATAIKNQYRKCQS